MDKSLHSPKIRVFSFFVGITLLFFSACSNESSGYPQPGEESQNPVISTTERFAERIELKPGPQDRMISRLVTTMIGSQNVSGKKIDKEISSRAFEIYIKTLDPMKMYFYQSDIDEFSKYKNTLGESAMEGDVSVGFEIYNRYLQRVDERLDMVRNELLNDTYNFTVDEELVRDKKLLEFSKSPEESKDRWRKRIKYDILLLKAEAREKAEKKKSDTTTNKPDDEDPFARLERRYASLQKRMHQTTNDEVIETYLTSITNGFDPHSTYMSPSTYENFLQMMALKLEGIGASLQSVDGYTVVKRLVPGGAAEKDGRLKLEDKIIGVGQGKDGLIEDIVDMKLTDVVSKIRGKKGTIVRLEVLPDDGSEKKLIEITREVIALEDAISEVFEYGEKPDGTPYRIGVIDLPSFYLDTEALAKGDPNPKRTVTDVQRILNDFVKKGVDAVILDLRLNGGGSLPEAVELTGLFIESGPVVQVKGKGPANSLSDTNSSIEWTGPLVVLCSKFSASASEIFAGAIKDYKRGIVVGDSTTHGKGSVQNMINLSDRLLRGGNGMQLGALKMTIQMFFRPAGESTQIEGVKSDIELPSITNHIEGISEADLDYPLEFAKIAPVKYPVFPYVNDELVKQLRINSAERIEKDPEFVKTIKKIDEHLAFLKKKTQTLDEEKFFAERDKFNEDKETDDLEKKISARKIERDYYMEEVLGITVDSIELLKKSNIEFPKEKSVESKQRIFNLFGR